MSRKGVKLLSLLMIFTMLTGCSSTPASNQGEALNGYNNEIVVNVEENNLESTDTLNEAIVEETVEETIIEETNDLLNPIEVKFIDVGQADSCLIVTANNDAILVDAGEDRDAEEIIEVIEEYDLEDIDLMVLTHPHADHIGGAKTILEKYKVKEVMMCSFVSTSKLFSNLLSTLESQELNVIQAEIGKTFNIDDVAIQVVGTDSVPDDNNNSSIVMKVTYGTVDMLLAGDAEIPAEKVILENGFDLTAEVLKLGHHGSRTSSGDEFLATVQPKIGIISCGLDNKYGLPDEDVLSRLDSHKVQYYRTDEVGTVTLEIDGENIVTSLEENFEAINARSGLFLYTPNVAEVGLELEDVVVENVAENLN